MGGMAIPYWWPFALVGIVSWLLGECLSIAVLARRRREPMWRWALVPMLDVAVLARLSGGFPTAGRQLPRWAYPVALPNAGHRGDQGRGRTLGRRRGVK